MVDARRGVRGPSVLSQRSVDYSRTDAPSPMVPSRLEGLPSAPQWYVPRQNRFISRAPWWWDRGTADVDARGPLLAGSQREGGHS